MSLRQLWNRLRLDLNDRSVHARRTRSRSSADRGRFRTTADFALYSQSLEQRFMLTSDLTEVLNYSSLQLTANDALEIEIGGAVPGNPSGGNNIDGYDQINVTGSLPVSLDGLLDVRLVNNYVPEVGTSFQFLTLPSTATVSGRFSTAFGLYSFPDNDRYFDITVVDDGLCLEVKAIPSGLRFAPPESQRDAFGRFLSTYFDETNSSFSYTAGICQLFGYSGICPGQ